MRHSRVTVKKSADTQLEKHDSHSLIHKIQKKPSSSSPLEETRNMPLDRGRFHPSAEGAKAGITLLVPRPVIDEEQEQILQMILTARVQQLIIHLRRGGIRHLDINERLRRGEFKGYAPLHVCVMRGTSSVVAALLELSQADPNVQARRPTR